MPEGEARGVPVRCLRAESWLASLKALRPPRLRRGTAKSWRASTFDRAAIPPERALHRSLVGIIASATMLRLRARAFARAATCALR